MLNKLNLKCDDRVEIIGFDSVLLLNKKKGTVAGVGIRDIVDFYIVILDEPIEYDNFFSKAITMPETNLKRI